LNPGPCGLKKKPTIDVPAVPRSIAGATPLFSQD
jgi:hypothetical protein